MDTPTFRQAIFQAAVAQLKAQRAQLIAEQGQRCFYCPTVYTNLEHYPYCSLQCAIEATGRV